MPERSHNSPYLNRLADALEKISREDRIGIPRFIRWLDRVDGGNLVADSLAAGIEVCNRVFGSEPAREYRTGDDRTHATVHAVWANGSSALISAGPAGRQAITGPEVMLLGSSGAAYFDGARGGATTVDLDVVGEKVGEN